MFQSLSSLFAPRSVVVIGASDRPDSIGQRTVANLVEHSDFAGELFLVNAGRDQVMGRRAYRSVTDLPHAPELAVIVVPAAAAVGVIRECGQKGIKFAVVLTSGFSEAGDDGKLLEQEITDIAKQTGIRVYGPNCPGLVNNNCGIGFTFSPAYKLDRKAGPIGLVTQGGGLGRTFLQASGRGMGIGLWCSSGNEADLTVSDYINHMVTIPEIKVIVTLLEGINDPERFVRAALNAAQAGKPIVALKVGKSEYGIKAAQSHTAALSGSAEVNSTAFRQLGIIEVNDIDEMIDTAALLARSIPPIDLNVAVYSFSGGTVALAADMLGEAELKLAEFAPPTLEALRRLLPSFAAIHNPVDTTAEVLVNKDISHASLLQVAQDPNVNAVLYPIPMEYGDTTLAACTDMVRVQATVDKPIIPVWMSDKTGKGYDELVRQELVPFRSLSRAVKAISRWNQYGRWRTGFEPSWEPAVATTSKAAASMEERQTYTEHEAKSILSHAGVCVPAGGVATTEDEALRLSSSIQGSVVAKVVSPDILHKSDIGGVRIGLRTDAEVADAWRDILENVRKAEPQARIDGILIEEMVEREGVETLVGVHEDPLFGPVITFGLGGVFVEIFRDVSRRLLPLTPSQAREMIEETRCHTLLKGVRGRPPADINALVELLIAVSDFVTKGPLSVHELDLNPVIVGRKSAVAVDAVLIASRRDI
ncbi:CoA-binding protein [Pusillimonas sp. TS35]|nr:CoA-binding protein [Pusillimonas sp. TS35]